MLHFKFEDSPGFLIHRCQAPLQACLQCAHRRSLYSGQKEFHSFEMATSDQYKLETTFPTSVHCGDPFSLR